MDISRLSLLRELADRGTLTAVAEATHRTTSAVSQQLKILEREAGVPLTERSGRGLALTAAGRELSKTARDVATAIERAEALWADFTSTPRGDVTLTIFPTAGQMLLPGVLRRVGDMPGLRVDCSDLDTFVADLADLTADFDVVVVDAPGVLPSWTERGLTVVPLLREQLDVAMPQDHPLADRSTLRPADLADETWIGVPSDLPFDRVLRGIEAVNETPARVAQRIGDNRIVEALIASGLGIGILPRYTTRDRENGLVTRPLEGVRSTRLISALMRPDRAERPSVRSIVAMLQAEAADIERAHESA